MEKDFFSVENHTLISVIFLIDKNPRTCMQNIMSNTSQPILVVNINLIVTGSSLSNTSISRIGRLLMTIPWSFP